MNTTVAVALIASVSTLAGAGISGFITFLVSRTNSSTQRTLADSNRMDQLYRERRQIRRDAYVQVLNQVGVVEDRLDTCWRSMPPDDMAHVGTIIAPITAELQRLGRRANLVALEGPSQVTNRIQALQVKLTLESVRVAEVAKVAKKGEALCLHDPKMFSELQVERNRAKTEVIHAAQQALDETSINLRGNPGE